MITRRSFLTLLGLAPAAPALAMLAQKAASIPAYEMVVGELLPFDYASGGPVVGCAALVGEIGPELACAPSLAGFSVPAPLQSAVATMIADGKSLSAVKEFVWDSDPEAHGGLAFDNADDLIAYLDDSV